MLLTMRGSKPFVQKIRRRPLTLTLSRGERGQPEYISGLPMTVRPIPSRVHSEDDERFSVAWEKAEWEIVPAGTRTRHG